METERSKVLHQSIEIFVTAGELVRNQTLSLLNEPFQRCSSAYASLASLITSNNGVIRFESSTQLKEMLMLFKDLATLIQLIGRLSELHTGPDFYTQYYGLAIFDFMKLISMIFLSSFEVGKSLVQKLVDLASYGPVVVNFNFVDIPADELKSTLSLV